jgi:hypothetical protein
VLDCLRDIVRRVSAKRAIQRPVVDSAEAGAAEAENNVAGAGAGAVPRGASPRHGHASPSHGANAPPHGWPHHGWPHHGCITPRTVTVGGGAHCHDANSGRGSGSSSSYAAFHNDDGELSHQGTLETAASTLADEKENAGDMDGSFDSTSTIDTTTLGDDGPSLVKRMSGVHFGSDSIAVVAAAPANAPAMTPRGGDSGGRDSFVAYHSVLSMLSDEARRSVEDMVRSMRHKVWEEARHSICQRSYEEGRKVGQDEGRMWGMQEAMMRSQRHSSSAAAPAFPKMAP